MADKDLLQKAYDLLDACHLISALDMMAHEIADLIWTYRHNLKLQGKDKLGAELWAALQTAVDEWTSAGISIFGDTCFEKHMAESKDHEWEPRPEPRG